MTATHVWVLALLVAVAGSAFLVRHHRGINWITGAMRRLSASGTLFGVGILLTSTVLAAGMTSYFRADGLYARRGDGDIRIWSNMGGVYIMLNEGGWAFTSLPYFRWDTRTPNYMELASDIRRWQGIHCYSYVTFSGRLMRVVVVSHWVPTLVFAFLTVWQFRAWRRLRGSRPGKTGPGENTGEMGQTGETGQEPIG